MKRPVYLDCNATTPIEPRVRDVVLHYLQNEYGNAGSRTHEFGTDALKAVNHAREQVASVVAADSEEIIFTSGATESNNLAILGLAKYGEQSGKKHIISTKIEHKAVLEPLEYLKGKSFEITLVSPSLRGWIDPDQIKKNIRDDTLLVSVMHVNNETGVIQPLSDIANEIGNHPCFFHCDAAQGFGKDILPLTDPRIDLVSVSAHKIYGPKGIGALVARKRGHERIPLAAITYGGGQERGLRPGTLPVNLIVGLGLAAEIAVSDHIARDKYCVEFKRNLQNALSAFEIKYYGDQDRVLSNTVNLSIADLDSEAIMLALKDVVAISNGSACTSSSHKPSYVLEAMGLPLDEIETATRWSWCHLTEEPDWDTIIERLQILM